MNHRLHLLMLDERLRLAENRAGFRRRSPGRVNRRWNNRGWNQPSRFSTLPLNTASPARMNPVSSPNCRHGRMTRDR